MPSDPESDESIADVPPEIVASIAAQVEPQIVAALANSIVASPTEEELRIAEEIKKLLDEERHDFGDLRSTIGS